MPINVDKKHWLAAKIDIVKRHIDLYDSSRASTQDWYQFNNVECLSVLFPYLLEVGGAIQRATRSYIQRHSGP